MAEKTNDTKHIRVNLINEITTALSEIRNRPEVAKRVGMSLSALNTHLNINSRYTNNIEKLGEIGKVVAEMLKEKRQHAQQILEGVKSDLQSA